MFGEFWNPDADDMPTERPPECPVCGADDPGDCDREKHQAVAQAQLSQRNAITTYLFGRGWKPEGAGLQRDWEYRVDLSGEYGYVWSLQRFTDSDNSEGIAVGRWQDMNIEGDTLVELIGALDRIAIQASERLSDARANRTRNWPAGFSERTTGSKADDLNDGSEDV